MTIQRKAAAALLASATVLGGLAAAPSASADSGGGCRGAGNPVADGIYDNPCAYLDPITNDVYAHIQMGNTANEIPFDVCAQLLRVNADRSTTEVADYGCYGWVDRDIYYSEFDTREISVSAGTYVVRSGFWATVNGVYAYYGDVESPRVYVP
jgi:hypothetical protein